MPVNKVYETCDRAVADFFDGATIMIGGFGSFGGLPIHLIVALAKQGAKNLTIIANQGGVGFELSKRIKPGGYQDIGLLVQNGQVKKFIGSVPALGGMPPTSPIETLHREGKIEIEIKFRCKDVQIGLVSGESDQSGVFLRILIQCPSSRVTSHSRHEIPVFKQQLIIVNAPPSKGNQNLELVLGIQLRIGKHYLCRQSCVIDHSALPKKRNC